MKKTIFAWSVEELRAQFPQINFPEYQREPNLWSLLDKRRLIDSMVSGLILHLCIFMNMMTDRWTV